MFVLNYSRISIYRETNMTDLFEFDDYTRNEIADIIKSEPNLLSAVYQIDQKLSTARVQYPCKIFRRIYGLMIGELIYESIKQYHYHFIDKTTFDQDIDSILEFVKHPPLKLQADSEYSEEEASS